MSIIKKRTIWILGLCSFVGLLLAFSIFWPRVCGMERSWNLKDGSLEDRWFLCGILLTKHTENSGLERYFHNQLGSTESSHVKVLIYSKSIIQPARGGQWLRVLDLAVRLHKVGAIQNDEDASKLVKLVIEGNDSELWDWYSKNELK